MAQFKVTGEFSGRTYTFNAESEDLTPDQVAHAQSVVRQREMEFADYYQGVTGKEADLRPGTALGRGIFDLGPTSAYSALGTAARGVGEKTGIAGLVNLGSSMEQSAFREQIAEAGRFAAAPSVTEAETVGDFFTAVGEGVGQSLPEMGATVGATIAGGLAGGPVGAYAAGATAATPLFLGRNLSRQEAQVAAGELDEVDFNRALGTAAAQSALNVVGEKVLLAGRALGLSVPVSQKLLTRIAQRGTAGVVAEASTEVLQQALERGQAEMPAGLDDPDAQAEYLEAAILGGIMGGGFAGATGAFQPPKAEQPAEDEQERAAASQSETPDPSGPVSESPEVTDAREYFEERAAVREFDDEVTREEAEASAAQSTLDMLEADGTVDNPALSTFVRAMRAKTAGGTAPTIPPAPAAPEMGAPTPPLDAYADEFGIDLRQGELPVEPPAVVPSPTTEAPASTTPVPSTTPMPTDPAALADQLVSLGIPPSAKAVRGAKDGSLSGPALAQALEAYAEKTKGKNAEARATAAREFANRLLSDVRPAPATADAQRTAIADDDSAGGAGVPDTGGAVGGPTGQDAGPAPAVGDPDGGSVGDAGADPAGADGRAGRTPAPLIAPTPRPAGAPTPVPSPMVAREGELPEGYDLLQGQGIPPGQVLSPAVSEGARPLDARAAAQRDLNQYVERSAGPELSAALRDMEADQEIDTVSTTQDRRAVLKLLRSPVRKGERAVGKSPVAAARRYFGSNYRVDMVLDEIAYDLVAARVWGEELRTTKTVKAAEGPDSTVPRIDAYLLRKGGPAAVNAADWVEQNMSDAAQEYLDARIVEYDDRAAKQARTARIEAGSAARARAVEAGERKFSRLADVSEGLYDPAVDPEFDTADLGGLDISFLERNAPNASLSGAVHPMVENQLRAGNLRGALTALAKTYPGRARRVAEALAEALPDVPVSVLSTEDMGTAMRVFYHRRLPPKFTPRGAYTSPLTDAELEAAYPDPDLRDVARDLHGSVLLDGGELTPHLILHEAVHALSQQTLRNPSHPLTRRLETLRGKLETALAGEYGMTNVKEFLSEAMSNPEFQQKLARVNVDGTPVSARKTLIRALIDWLRGIVGLRAKTSTAQDVADGVFAALLDNPTPEYRRAGAVSEVSFLPREARAVASPQPARLMEKFTPESAKRVTQMMGNLSVPVPVLEGAIRGLVPLRNLVDMAKDRIPNAEQIYKLLEEHGARVSNDTDEARATIARVGKFMKAHPDKVDTFNDMRLLATLHELDPRKPDNFYVDNRYRLFYDILDSNGSFLRREVKGYKTEAERAVALNKLNQNPPTGRSKAKGMKPLSDDDLKLFRELRNMYRDLGTEGQAAYADVLAPFKHYHKRVGDVLRVRLRALFPQDPSMGTSVYNDIYHKILASSDDTFHQPLQRRGAYWVAYRKFEGPNDTEGELYKEAFMTAREREEALAALDEIAAEDGGVRIDDITPYEVDMNGRRNKEVPLAFVSDMMGAIEGAGQMTPELRQQLVDLVFDAAPERSFVQTWRTRKGTKGFLGGAGPLGKRLSRRDTIELLQQKAFSTSRQLADMEYGARLQEQVGEARRTVEARARPEGGGTSVERARRNQTDAMFLRLFEDYSKAVRTQRSGWSRTVTAGTYGMTLGLNVSTAALTFMQIPTIIIPHLGAKYGMGSMTGALGRAMRTLSGTGGERQQASIQPDGDVASETVKTSRADLSLMNVDFDAEGFNTPQWQRLRPLAEEMRRRGMDGRTIVSEVLGTDDDPSVSWFQKTVALSGAMQRHTERFVREATALAAYEMELKKRADGRKLSELSTEEMADAADAAIYETELTNGTIMAAGAPLWAQGNVGAIVYLYKRFGLHMVNLLGRQVVRSLGRNPDPQDRRIARLQLGTTLGAVALFSGVQGLPFFHAAAAAYDLLLQGDDEEDFETIVRTGLMGELGYNGVVNYVTNANVASRIGLSGMLYREPFNADSKPWLYAQLQAVGGPAVGLTMDAVDRGIPLLADGEIYRGAEALLPSAIANPMRAYRFTSDGPSTMRGDPIIDDISPVGAAAQFFGFAPADYIRQLEQNAQLKRINDAVTTQRTRLLKKRYIAYRTGDREGYQAAMREIREFNEDNPQNPITAESMEKSLTSHQKSSTRMHHGVLFDRKNEPMLRAMARDWGPVTIYE